MKQSFRSLTWAAVAVATVTLEVKSQEGSGFRVQGSAATTAAQAPTPEPRSSSSGQQLVAEAARRIASEPAISADLRYRIDAFGHELVGSGNYLQLGTGAEKLLRLELRMQLGDRLATLLEIRGQDFYWTRREIPPAPPSLGRVDLRQLRKSMALAGGQPTDVLPQEGWIVLGGLPRLMSSLERNFEFDSPQMDELQFKSTDGQSVVRLPIWIVSGQWKPERLETLVELDASKRHRLPDQLPDSVELFLGRTDDILPLFPYRITYWRSADADPTSGDATTTARLLLKIDLFNVSRQGNLDPRDFEFQPGDQEVQNLTSAYLQRYHGETKAR